MQDQNALEQNKTPSISIGGRSLSIGQLLLGIIVLAVIGFLIVGSLNQPDTTDSFSFAPTSSFPVLALIALMGGLLSFLSPCTLPILPAYFAFAFQGGRSTIAANTFAFMLGLATMFSLTGAAASTLGTILYNQSNLILLLGGSVVIVFGIMSLIGQGFGGISKASQHERSTSVGGSFVFGLTFAVGWSSCVGPIYGIILALAATTASVSQGMMLLFIYALGLGLPLMVMSAIFGRASRDSFIWRALRGKGWEKQTNNVVVAAIWAVGAWLIAMPLIRYAFPTFNLDGTNPLIDWEIPFFGGMEIGLSIGITEIALLLLLIGIGALFAYATQGGVVARTLHLHSTQLFSGVLFILMGVLLVNNMLSIFNGLAETDLALRMLDIEDAFLSFFFDR